MVHGSWLAINVPKPPAKSNQYSEHPSPSPTSILIPTFASEKSITVRNLHRATWLHSYIATMAIWLRGCVAMWLYCYSELCANSPVGVRLVMSRSHISDSENNNSGKRNRVIRSIWAGGRRTTKPTKRMLREFGTTVKNFRVNPRFSKFEPGGNCLFQVCAK